MKKFLLLLLLILIISGTANATRAEEDNIDDFLEDSKQTALIKLRELSRLNIAQNESDRVYRALDRWSKTNLPEILNRHYGDVESILPSVTLGEDVGTFGVYWAQLNAGVTRDTALNAMITEFMNNTQIAIQDSANALEKEISDDLSKELLKHFTLASENIHNQYNLTLSQVFGKEFVSSAFNTPSVKPILEKYMPEIGKENESSSSHFSLAIGISMIMVPLVKRALIRISATIAAKIGGNLLAKLLPIVGWAMIAWEAVTVFNAKANFEEELRKNFLTEYKQSLNAEAIWMEEGVVGDSSFEKTMQGLVTNFCMDIENQCKNMAIDLTEISDIVKMNPALGEYVKNESEGGIDPILVFDTIKQLYTVFKEKLTSVENINDIQILEQIYIRIPTSFRGQFARLSDVTGQELIELFSKDKAGFDTLLTKVQLIGVDNYLKHRSDVDKMDKELFMNTFAPYTSFIIMDKDACNGVFLLIRSGLLAAGWQQAALRRISIHAGVFTAILPHMREDYGKLVEIFQSERRLSTFLKVYEKEPGFSITAAKFQPIAFWDVNDADKIEKIFSLTAYLKKTSNSSPEEVINTVTNNARLLGIYEEHGKDGIDIWQRFVGKDSGVQQEKIAESAIQLMSQGFPADKLMTIRDVRIAQCLDYIPILGVFLFNVGYELSFLVFIIPAGIIIWILAYFIYKFFIFYKKYRQTGINSVAVNNRVPPDTYAIDAEVSVDTTKQLEDSNANSGK